MLKDDLNLIGKIFSGKLSKKHDSDAGQDIHSAVDKVIPPRSSLSISTGLKIAVPPLCVGLVWPRSGSSFGNSIETGAGVIDQAYRGEVMVKLYNHSDKPFEIKKGDRIAQLLTIPCVTSQYVKISEIDETERGEDGFGSSGSGEEIE